MAGEKVLGSLCVCGVVWWVVCLVSLGGGDELFSLELMTESSVLREATRIAFLYLPTSVFFSHDGLFGFRV